MERPISREHYNEANEILSRLHRLYMAVPGDTIGFGTLEDAVDRLAEFVEDEAEVEPEAT